ERQTTEDTASGLERQEGARCDLVPAKDRLLTGRRGRELVGTPERDRLLTVELGNRPREIAAAEPLRRRSRRRSGPPADDELLTGEGELNEGEAVQAQVLSDPLE